MSGVAKFKHAWRGVPAGTVVDILGRFTDLHGDEILLVARPDRTPLPTPGGPFWKTSVASDFIEE